MTIPIIPGPFSFIAELGKGVGTAFQTAENQKRVLRGQAQEDRAEALKQVGVIFDAVQNNQMTANTLKSPFFQELIKRSGLAEQFDPANVAAKPSDQIAEGQSQFLSQLMDKTEGAPDRTAERQQTLATGKIQTPTEVAQGREGTARANVRADVIESGGAAGRAAAEVLAPEVARTQEEKVKDVQYDTQAARMADAAITNMGGNILQMDPRAVSEQAWAKAQADAKTKGEVLDESLTRPYIDAAVQSRFREALTEDARIKAASARGPGNDLDNYLRLLQQQQQMIRNQINALPKPDDLTMSYATAYEAQAGTKRPPEQQRLWETSPGTLFLKSAYDRVQEYNKTIAQLTNEANGYRDQLGNALQPLTGQGGATPGREERKLDDAKVDAIVRRMREQNIPPTQVDADVQAGKITAADGAAIKSRLTAGAGGRF